MTENEIKILCKLAVDNSNRSLSDLKKELIKQAIDKAKTPADMVASILVLLSHN